MEAYVLTNKLLLDLGFSHVINSDLLNIGVKLFTNGLNFVVLQRWENETPARKIILEASLVRDILLRQKLNVWNSYYLLCTGGDRLIDEETIYTIERDSLSIRKFVIRSMADIRRIPFLDDNNDTYTELNKNSIDDIEQDPTISYLLKNLRDKEGERKALKKKLRV